MRVKVKLVMIRQQYDTAMLMVTGQTGNKHEEKNEIKRRGNIYTCDCEEKINMKHLCKTYQEIT